MNNKYICVTIGDINGIGINLLLNLYNEKKIKQFFLITNYNLFIKFLKKKKIKLKTKIINNEINIKKSNHFLIYDLKANNNVENTYKSLICSHYLVKNSICSGVINLPLNKEKIINKVDSKFIGQTELYQKLEQKKYANMIFYSKKIITSTLTTHIPINKINMIFLKKNLIFNKIKLLFKTLTNDFNIKKPKIILLGLNPHAGENGKIGKEELLLKKILNKLKIENIKIYGPSSADSIFSKKNLQYYDCFLSLYHDQALIPFKIISNNLGVNFTGSLKLIRLSPVHGTAYDLVNSNKGNYNSLLFCFNTINKIIFNRKQIDKT